MRTTTTPTTLIPMKARVHNGRLLLDEPTDLPDGTEVEIALLDRDDLTRSERAQLDAALDLDAAAAAEAAGRVHPLSDALAEINKLR